MKHLFAIVVLLLTIRASAQSIKIDGVVENKDNHEILQGASIFINNSTYGTVSDDSGKFSLPVSAQQSFDLVISYVGFKTEIVKINRAATDTFLVVALTRRPAVLNNISLVLPEKDGWEKWGGLFEKIFLGRSDFASRCTIKNHKVLKFFYSKSKRVLMVYSDGNLQIINKALGYSITCQLEDFQYDLDNKVVKYTDYVSFTPLTPRNRNVMQRWEKARSDVYFGSVMHFMRCLYADSLKENGFDVHEKIRVENDDSLFYKIYKGDATPKEIESGGDTFTVVIPALLPGQKIPTFADLVNLHEFQPANYVRLDSSSRLKLFYFDNYIQVVYRNGFEKEDFLLSQGQPVSARIPQTSDAHLLSDEALAIQKNGAYWDPINFMTTGYWGWYNIAELLPTDYISK